MLAHSRVDELSRVVVCSRVCTFRRFCELLPLRQRVLLVLGNLHPLLVQLAPQAFQIKVCKSKQICIAYMHRPIPSSPKLHPRLLFLLLAPPSPNSSHALVSPRQKLLTIRTVELTFDVVTTLTLAASATGTTSSAVDMILILSLLLSRGVDLIPR